MAIASISTMMCHAEPNYVSGLLPQVGEQVQNREVLQMKPVTVAATFLLAAVSLAHLIRILFGVRVTVADSVIPMWVSGAAFVVAGGLAIMLWRSTRRGG